MHRTLLVVEGPHDLAVVHALLHRRGLRVVRSFAELDPQLQCLVPRVFPQGDDLLSRVAVPRFFHGDGVDVVVATADGDARLVQTVDGYLQRLAVSANAVGMVLDADGARAAARFERLRTKWRTTLDGVCPPPQAPGEVLSGPMRVGVFVLPDNDAPGALEVLLRGCAAAEWPGALEIADAFLLGAEPLLGGAAEALRTASNRHKAPISALHALMRPGKAVQTSLEDGLWFGRAAFDQVPALASLDCFLWALVDPQPTAPPP